MWQFSAYISLIEQHLRYELTFTVMANVTKLLDDSYKVCSRSCCFFAQVDDALLLLR